MNLLLLLLCCCCFSTASASFFWANHNTRGQLTIGLLLAQPICQPPWVSSQERSSPHACVHAAHFRGAFPSPMHYLGRPCPVPGRAPPTPRTTPRRTRSSWPPPPPPPATSWPGQGWEAGLPLTLLRWISQDWCWNRNRSVSLCVLSG